MNKVSTDAYLAYLQELSPDVFATSLVHDLRNKIHGILAGVSVIQEIVTDVDMPETALKQIQQSSEYIRGYSKDMMAMLDAYLKYDEIQRGK